MPDSPTSILADLLAQLPLDEARAESAFEILLTGGLNDAQIGAMLALIAVRGPTVDELVGAAKAMRRHATHVPFTSVPLVPILDTCGTGGAPKLFNISTLGAIVTCAAAPGRVLAAKHGNRSRTGRGSAELLEALGVDILAPASRQALCLRQIGICFSYAPAHHPAAKFAAGPRKSLAFPTIFNLVGPLANPAGATHQLVGTFSLENARKLAAALARLGVQRAMVCCSDDGLDELTTTASNNIYHVRRGEVVHDRLDAQDLGFPVADLASLQAVDLSHAVDIAKQVLANAPGPCTDLVVLNAAASLVVCDLARDLPHGVDLAREALASGRPAAVLQDLIRLSRSAD